MKKMLFSSILWIFLLNLSQADDLIDGKNVYKNCVSCHGLNGDSPALGKSALINTMSFEQITKAIYGYLDGNYGGDLKIIMKVEAQKLTDEEIKAVAKYIQTLK